MNNSVEKLISNFSELFDGEPWLGGAIMPKLNSINYLCVNEKIGHSKNTIAILLQHMINWRVFTIEKIKENTRFDIEMNSQGDWTDIRVNSELEWENLKLKLVETQTKIQTALKNQITHQNLEEVVAGKNYNLEYLLEGLIQHDIYHFGQIGLLYAQLKTT